MSGDLPKRIEIHEEGPREGFQFEREIFPLADRVAFVDALTETGLRHIQVASFVSPKAVPQMADAEAFFAAIRKKPGVRHTGLWLNEAGFGRALQCSGIDLVGSLYLYTTDAFSRRNNGCTAAEMRQRQEGWIDRYDALGIEIEAVYVMTVFGCALQGEVPTSALDENLDWIARQFSEKGRNLPAIYLADTVGWAVPTIIENRIGRVRERFPAARVGLHLHDTRGTGIANFLAALRMGVDLYDSSVAGLGGCPFAGHSHGAAAGNVCTEDMVYMAHEMGIETGIDLDLLIEAARMAERIIGRPLAGRLMHSGLPRRMTD